MYDCNTPLLLIVVVTIDDDDSVWFPIGWLTWLDCASFSLFCLCRIFEERTKKRRERENEREREIWIDGIRYSMEIKYLTLFSSLSSSRGGVSWGTLERCTVYNVKTWSLTEMSWWLVMWSSVVQKESTLTCLVPIKTFYQKEKKIDQNQSINQKLQRLPCRLMPN